MRDNYFILKMIGEIEMSKPLFYNVGGEIKLLAESKAFSIKFCYGLLAVMIVALGILFGIESDMPMLVFVALCIAGVVFYYGYTKAQMTVLELYAYGELVEKVVSIENQLSAKGVKK